ncbi:hypothetical protein BDR04DRAFT_521375 [Suillus decipiens]|nr:hypothetical protein BDR04DRAFT_521375 [Suillus decipiens]
MLLHHLFLLPPSWFLMGSLLPVAVPSPRQLVENFSMFIREQFTIIVHVHVGRVMSNYCKDHICDMVRMHVCDAKCMSNLVVSKGIYMGAQAV